MREYPYIPKKYYEAVIYACKIIRETGYFHKACRIAVEKYGVDEETLKKHVQVRRRAGRRMRNRRIYESSQR